MQFSVCAHKCVCDWMPEVTTSWEWEGCSTTLVHDDWERVWTYFYTVPPPPSAIPQGWSPPPSSALAELGRRWRRWTQPAPTPCSAAAKPSLKVASPCGVALWCRPLASPQPGAGQACGWWRGIDSFPSLPTVFPGVSDLSLEWVKWPSAMKKISLANHDGGRWPPSPQPCHHLPLQLWYPFLMPIPWRTIPCCKDFCRPTNWSQFVTDLLADRNLHQAQRGAYEGFMLQFCS